MNVFRSLGVQASGKAQSSFIDVHVHLNVCLSVCLSVCMRAGRQAGRQAGMDVCMCACVYIAVCVCLFIFRLVGRNSEFNLQIVRTAVITLSVAILAINRSARIFDRRRGNRLHPISHVVPSNWSILHLGSAAGFPVRAAEEPPADTVGQWAFYIPIDRRLPQRASGDWIVAGGVVIEQLCHGDERLISPFQNCLVDEIMANAAGSINVLTERDPAMLPNSGYHCSLFAKYPLAGISRRFRCSPCRRRPEAHVLSGTPMKSSSVPLGFSAVHTAGHVRHFGHLCGCQGLQWRAGPVPLGVQSSENTGRTLTSRSSSSSATRC